ncbi:hypothetical protein [Arthrobacter sp. N199823]|uniref:hypothetical protein n=1 Tax=Arthrobacter sp. N199823 TaxID=2058895 RepID=UPI000CE54414|nr:hypothetical protein [Arthrobacter sp. N199823]
MSGQKDELVSKIVVDGNAALGALMTNMNNAVQGLTSAENWDELRDQAPYVISSCVASIKSELWGRDFWDVLTNLRQFVSPTSLSNFKESEYVRFPAAVEVVAIVGISAVSTETGSTKRQVVSSEPEGLVERIYASAAQIIHLAHMLPVASSEEKHRGKAAELAGILRSHDVSVRGRNYLSTSRTIAHEIFDPSSIQAIVKQTSGYTYSELESVWDGIQSYLTSLVFGRLERLQEIAQEWASGDQQSQATVDEGKEIARLQFQRPGLGTRFTAEDVARECGVDEKVVTTVLENFSVDSLTMSPVDGCTRFVHGTSPIAGKGMLRDPDGSYLIIGDPIPHDYVRPKIESDLKKTPKKWNQYQRHRDNWVEESAARLIAGLLDEDSPTYFSLKYRAPSGTGTFDLSRDSKDPRHNTLDTEADALFVTDDVAICLEVKAGSITEKARSGNALRVETDIKKTIGEAADQAERLRKLIETNHGLWKSNGKWLDLSSVREVHSVVVCLDDWGPLAIATDALVRSGFIKSNTIPWLVSLHDLYVIETLLERPADFLTYLRRRTDSGSARLFIAVDELDLVMWHIQGNFYFDPDPDVVHKLHPVSSVPTSRDRRRYKESSVPTRVGTLTDPLDAWMYYKEGQSSVPASKPERTAVPLISALLDFLQKDHKPGWLRFGADIAGLSEASQNGLGRNLKEVVKLTRSDGRVHSYAQNHVDLWGHGVFLVCSKPATESLERCSEHLESYVHVKKYQLRADRALGVVVNERSEFVNVQYRNDKFVYSQAMEQLVVERGLRDPRRTGNSIPPSARRTTVRLKAKRNKKRR